LRIVCGGFGLLNIVIRPAGVLSHEFVYVFLFLVSGYLRK